jgi:hypothetical protein
MKSNLALAARQVSDLKSIPSPTGGLNARDSLMAMAPDQAITLINFFPQKFGAQLRLGWAKHQLLVVPAPIETLMNYAARDGTEILFAAAGKTVYNVTPQNGTPVKVPNFNIPFANDRWQFTMMNNENANFLIIVNGADIPQKFNGTAWTDCVLTKYVSTPPDPVPFDPKKMIHVHSVHRRLWFTEKDSGNAWYLPTDFAEGEVKRFSVGEIFPRGGYLQCIKSWTVDSATGSDDHIVFISSEGDIAVYTGFDPDATDGSFTLDGVYRIGGTIGRRCAVKYGSDLLILCEDGVLPLTSILAQSKVLDPTPITDMILLKLSDDVSTYSSRFGWQLLVHNRDNQLYINVPDPLANRQYVMNTVTGAWCQFENYDGLCWEIHKDEVFFGMPNGTVAHGWFGTTDALDFNDLRGGAIQGTALGSFAYLGRGAQQKHITMARASLHAPVLPQYRLGCNVDFNIEDDSPPIPPATVSEVVALWNQAKWDQAKWAIASRIFGEWIGVGEIGFCAAPFLKMSTSFGCVWINTDLLSEEGKGIL